MIHGLTKHTPPSSDEVFKLLEVGNARRSMSPTDQNAQSSRSHAVLQIWVTQVQKNQKKRLRCEKTIKRRRRKREGSQLETEIIINDTF